MLNVTDNLQEQPEFAALFFPRGLLIQVRHELVKGDVVPIAEMNECDFSIGGRNSELSGLDFGEPGERLLKVRLLAEQSGDDQADVHGITENILLWKSLFGRMSLWN